MMNSLALAISPLRAYGETTCHLWPIIAKGRMARLFIKGAGRRPCPFSLCRSNEKSLRII